MKKAINIFWLRRDLRLDDNIGLCKALSGKNPVLPIFIFDSEILDGLPKDDARVTFIFESLEKLRLLFQEKGSDIDIRLGKPVDIFKQITEEYNIQNVITNRDYEAYGQNRDRSVEALLSEKEIGFYTYKDHVIFEQDEIVKADKTPYVVYTPYMKRWKERLKTQPIDKLQNNAPNFDNLLKIRLQQPFTIEKIGFIKSSIEVPDFNLSPLTIQQYSETRNYPSLDATSHLGPHLRFGTISIRKVIGTLRPQKDESLLQELIWREFFIQILWHFPQTTHNAFRPKYDRIEWRNNDDEFENWKAGSTGYPIVDAGMRQLAKTGYMHNRVRMVVASFLCKHLLIDWRWGEAYFAEKLLDYEQASNVGNWQWVAGSGVDAAPYFRIFNPSTQLEKFDSDQKYTKKWIVEFETEDYPEKIVDHRIARERCLKAYKTALYQ